MRQFDRILIADWSGANMPSPARPTADAIWISVHDRHDARAHYFRTRHAAELFLKDQIAQTLGANQTALIGFDFPLGYPAGFAKALTGLDDVRGIWDYVAGAITDTERNENNRFRVANDINARFGNGPFWGRPAHLDAPHLPAKKHVDYAALPFAERRQIEKLLPSAQPVWKLYTTGSVGSQSLMGLPLIHRLAQMPQVSVWPFDPPTTAIVLAEVYPSILAQAVSVAGDAIKDRAQVLLLAKALYGLSRDHFNLLLNPNAQVNEEGWILGATYGPLLASHL